MSDETARLMLVPPPYDNATTAAPTTSDDPLDPLQVFLTLWRGKWTILFYVVLLAILGGYYAFEVAEPKYSATIELVREENSQQVVDIQSIVSGTSTEDEAINTELQIVKSRTLILELIRDMDLTNDPEFNERLRQPSIFSLSTLVDLSEPYLSLDLPEPPEPTAQEVELEVAKAVQKAISASSQPNTYLIQITVRTGDPVKSEQMANRLAQIYLDYQLRVKFTEIEFAINWLSERVTSLEVELYEKENKIKELRAETELVSLEALEILRIRAKDIRQRLTDNDNAIAAATAKIERIATLSEARDFVGIAAEYNTPTLNRLATRADAGQPGADSAFFAQLESLQGSDAANLNRVLSQATSLQASLDLIQTQIEDQNSDLVALNQLEREAEATKVLYETFLSRFKEATVQIGLQRADSRVLAEAVTGEQVAPRKALLLATAIVLGGLLGVAVIMIRSRLQNGFRTVEELEQGTGFTVLGQIPVMPIRRRSDLLDYLRTKPTSAASEAIRNLRTSILLSNVDNPPQIIMSTSSVPGEGKTTQSIALAQNLSGLGKKVLLIEGDIRRRTFEKHFKTVPKGNLVSVVSGDEALADAVLSDVDLGFDIVMGGKSTINAADLFSSDKFRNFLDEARAAYDFVIIDTPPVLVVPDARVIGNHADAIIYSVRWDHTNQFQVVSGLRQFSSVGLRVSGLVLSQISPRGMRRYGYGGRYGAYASYGKGYYSGGS